MKCFRVVLVPLHRILCFGILAISAVIHSDKRLFGSNDRSHTLEMLMWKVLASGYFPFTRFCVLIFLLSLQLFSHKRLIGSNDRSPYSRNPHVPGFRVRLLPIHTILLFGLWAISAVVQSQKADWLKCLISNSVKSSFHLIPIKSHNELSDFPRGIFVRTMTPIHINKATSQDLYNAGAYIYIWILLLYIVVFLFVYCWILLGDPSLKIHLVK